MELSEVENFDPFKSIKYRLKKKSLKDPFFNLKQSDKVESKNRFLSQRQTSLIIKPIEFKDVVDYYNVLYQESSFKSSLMGQPPERLMMHKICNKTHRVILL